ncbi:MAG: heavy metal-associated domain-containing protein [Thermodesulfobacteriota bacterium]
MKDRVKLGVITGAIAVLVALSISFVAAKNSTNSGQDLLETTLQVSNLSCGSCLANIEGELRQYEGMAGMNADLSRGIVVISHTEELSPQKIAASITGIGYPAKVVVSQAAGGKIPGNPALQRGSSGCGGCGPRGCGLPVPPPAPEKG